MWFDPLDSKPAKFVEQAYYSILSGSPETLIHCYDYLLSQNPGTTPFGEDTSGGLACGELFMARMEELYALSRFCDSATRGETRLRDDGVSCHLWTSNSVTYRVRLNTKTWSVAGMNANQFIPPEPTSVSTIPDSYTRLLYVASTGMQYVATGVTFKPGTSAEVKFSPLAAGKQVIAGACSGESGASAELIVRGVEGGGSTVDINVSPYMYYGQFSALKDYYGVHTATITNGVKTVDGVHFGGTQTAATPLGAFSFFHDLANWDSTQTASYYGKAWLYGACLRYGDTVIGDYVPCQNSSGVAGLWDEYWALFYSPSGGELVAGPAKGASSTVVEVACDPFGIGESAVYGGVGERNFAAGEEVRIAAHYRYRRGGGHYVCIGWTLYDEEGEELARSSASLAKFTMSDPAKYRRLVFHWRHFAEGREPLPTGYTRLEYIQSDGMQQIMTGVVPTTSTRVVYDFALTTTNQSSRAGWCASGNKDAFYWGVSGGYFYWNMHDDALTKRGEDNLNVIADTARHVFDLKSGSLKFDGVEYATRTFTDTPASTAELFLLALKGQWLDYASAVGSPFTPMKCKLYGCQIYSGETAVRDFVPALKEATGEYGLYDVVNDKFYGSAKVAGEATSYLTPLSAGVPIADPKHRVIGAGIFIR